MGLSPTQIQGLGIGADLVAQAGQGIFGAIHAKKAYKRNVEQWHRANEYNSTAAQMQRFKDAGLNPHLIYGKGTAGLAASSAPEYKAPDTPKFSFNPQKLLLAAQLRHLNAQTHLIQSQERRQNAETSILGYEMPYHKFKGGKGRQFAANELRELENRASVLASQFGVNQRTMDKIVKEINVLKQTHAGKYYDNVLKEWQANIVKKFNIPYHVVAPILAILLGKKLFTK